MFQRGKIAGAIALTALWCIPLAAQEASPRGEIGVGTPALTSAHQDALAAAAAACDNSVPRNTSGGGRLERYKLSYLYAITEYDRANCEPHGAGSWTLNKQQKCKEGKDMKDCGTVTLGKLTGLHLGNGECPDRTYDFASICYKWERHNNAKVTDRIDATWHPPTLPDQSYQFPVDVKVVRPVGEDDTFVGFVKSRNGAWGKWLITLKPPKDDPTFDFTDELVREAYVNPVDSCKARAPTVFPKGSKDAPEGKPETWTVGVLHGEGVEIKAEKNQWGWDYHGWLACAFHAYRCAGVARSGCGIVVTQQIQIKSPVDKDFVDVYQNTVGESMNGTIIEDRGKIGYGEFSSRHNSTMPTDWVSSEAACGAETKARLQAMTNSCYSKK